VVPSHPDRVRRELYRDYVYQPAKAIVPVSVDWLVAHETPLNAVAVALGAPPDLLGENPARVEKADSHPGTWIEPTADAPWGV
jgi:hypothetical protein